MTKLINTWQEFAEITIKTNDLDPMYSVIAGLNKYKSRDWMGRFIMYFLLFYDAGGAAVVADMASDQDFWEVVRSNAATPEVKRGTERRHFRGENARKAIEKLASFNKTPWQLLTYMYPSHSMGTPTYDTLYKWITGPFAGTQFGPYFIWKLYDIFNVCLGMPISLTLEEAVKYMPDEPKKAAAHFFPDLDFINAVNRINVYIAQFPHPVREGKCGLAEAETVLCMMKGFFKTKSHLIGDDIQDKWDQLEDYPELRALLPKEVESSEYRAGELG